MSEPTQGNNAGDPIDPNQVVSFAELAAQYRALTSAWSKKLDLKEELFGLQKECQRLLTASNQALNQVLWEKDRLRVRHLELRRQGTIVSADEARYNQSLLNSSESFFEDGSAGLTDDMADLKATEDELDRQIADIKARLAVVERRIDEA
ncbi:unnamed protein product [Clonostachys solani]|uniref:Uncharacterized protein n=1 Tax=Clonostachys solani TaxID=160281 RepID=A0A9N9ZGL2_9HYPO|nr:unnamed protein product [Clonostachys solani]